MAEDSFMYVISSRDGINSSATAHDLIISLNGLPTRYRKYKCQVKGFSLNVKSITTAFKDIQSQIFLSSNNFISGGLENSNSDIPNIIAYCDTISGINNHVNIEFIINNNNGSLVRFTLLDTIFSGVAGTDINQGGINTAWTLILKLTGIKD